MAKRRAPLPEVIVLGVVLLGIGVLGTSWVVAVAGVLILLYGIIAAAVAAGIAHARDEHRGDGTR